MKGFKYILIFTLLIVSLLVPDILEAQCAMCKAGAEANLKAGGLDGKGLNNGILYMLSMPYALISILAFVWWRNRRKEKDMEQVLHMK